MNKITCVCLGVKNMKQAIKFYKDLGFQTNCEEENPPVCFFDTTGTKFELYPLELLAKDIDNENPPQIGKEFGGITLAYNVANKEDVEATIALVKAAGGRIIKAPQEVFWGGYHAYFSDVDGYYWEVAWGPNFLYDEHGMLKL